MYVYTCTENANESMLQSTYKYSWCEQKTQEMKNVRYESWSKRNNTKKLGRWPAGYDVIAKHERTHSHNIYVQKEQKFEPMKKKKKKWEYDDEEEEEAAISIELNARGNGNIRNSSNVECFAPAHYVAMYENCCCVCVHQLCYI